MGASSAPPNSALLAANFPVVQSALLTPDDPWPMYPIASDRRGPNSIGAADINGDGYLDYVTNYQFDQNLCDFAAP